MFDIEGVCHTDNGRAVKSNWRWWSTSNSRRHCNLQVYYKVKRWWHWHLENGWTTSCWNHLEAIYSELEPRGNMGSARERKRNTLASPLVPPSNPAPLLPNWFNSVTSLLLQEFGQCSLYSQPPVIQSPTTDRQENGFKKKKNCFMFHICAW